MSHAKSNVESTTVSNPLFRVACLGALLLLVGSGPLLANGWFYHSIPYEALIRGLDSESPDYRSMAAMALGMRRESRAVPKLLQGLEAQGERLQVKIEIFRALGWIGDPATEPVLLQGLREAAPELRAEAADALAQLAPPEALSPLLQAFEREQDLIVRTRLVAALGSYEQPAAIASLVRVLEDGESSTLRVHATRALGHAGVATSARPLLETLATAGDGKLRREIVSALGQIGSPVAQEPLTRLLTATQEPELRARVTVALGSIGGAGAVPALIELLQDEAPAIRFFAVRGLARAEDGRAVAPLAAFYRRLTERHADAAPAEILRRPAPYLADLEMRLEIVRALTRIDPPAARDVLLDAAVPVRFARDSAAALKLNQAAYQLRRAAIFGLGYTRSAAATRFLSSAGGALADRDFRIRSIAVRALGTLSRSEAVAAVLEKLDDKVAEVRWEASLVLGRFADRQAVEPLLARLSDPHPEVRYHAVLGLGYLGDARAAGRIEALLESERSPKVRQAILTTLGLFGQPAVVG